MKKFPKFLLVLFLITGWVFSGWPQVGDNLLFSPHVKMAYANVLTIRPTADGDVTQLAPLTAGNYDEVDEVSADDGTTYVQNVTKNSTGYDLYQVTDHTSETGTINSVTVWIRCTQAAKSGSTAATVIKTNSTEYRGSTNSLGVYANYSTLYSTNPNTSSAWTWSEIDALQAGAELVNPNTGGIRSQCTQVWVVVDYTPPPNSAPNAPSQDLPTNSDTGVSVTPNFLMTATDPDSDDLGYKTTIYSASGCSASLVSTHDQSVTSTGWASTDASCTAEPTSCYASGTQGDFTLQAGDALSNSTQYWWRASAKDPDGNGSFTDSATCNTFTTGAAVVYSVSITSSGTVTYGSVGLSTATSTEGDNGFTQTAQHNGSGGPEKINIKSSNATGGTTWVLASSIDANVYKHEVSTTTGSTWMVMPDDATYIVASSTAAVNNVVDLDFRLTTPSSSADYQQKSITITVQAVAP